ncbi:hypothetical protein [Pseudomonas sp. dw_358]|uniref:hypothetical protein n=1 Tax=Pseudomonas sp. dw_358 TaxID=2720083 RepID=UPI001BD2FD9B|nr:hypothetical protein [Pseudomonas sp. dw_358]
MTTLLDVQLARLLYPLLVEIAAGKTPRSTQQFLHLAHTRFLSDRRVGQLIPARLGRVLAVIRHFTEQHDLPDLTRTVNLPRDHEPALLEHQSGDCFGYSWAKATADFNLYGAIAERALTSPHRLSRETATRVMSDYYFEHREPYAQVMRHMREVVIENLINGMGVAEAFEVEARLLAAYQGRI